MREITLKLTPKSEQSEDLILACARKNSTKLSFSLENENGATNKELPLKEQVRQFVISKGDDGAIHKELVLATGNESIGGTISSMIHDQVLRREGKPRAYRYFLSKKK